MILLQKGDIVFWKDLWSCTFTRTFIAGLEDLLCATTLLYKMNPQEISLEFEILSFKMKVCDLARILLYPSETVNQTFARAIRVLVLSERKCLTLVRIVFFWGDCSHICLPPIFGHVYGKPSFWLEGFVVKSWEKLVDPIDLGSERSCLRRDWKRRKKGTMFESSNLISW